MLHRSLFHNVSKCRTTIHFPSDRKLMRLLSSTVDITSSDDGLVYVEEPDIEELEAYTPGGFHPTDIGDQFCDGRYEVVHKLGYGGYSLIWLAQDKPEQRYVALKILAASETTAAKESKILRYLQQANDKHIGFPVIQRLLDEFLFDGPNGRHLCLVTDAAGNNLAVSKEFSPNYMFPVEAAQSLCAQLISSVVYIHASGICHGGLRDLHMRNLLLSSPGFNSMTVEEIYKRYGKPMRVPVRRVDGGPLGPHAPSHGIFCLGLGQPANLIHKPVVTINDFGTSFFAKDEKNPRLHTPMLYAPPEDLFSESITTAADIWTLGINLYDIMGERPLFEVIGADRDDIIGEMVSTLGPLPARWWQKWENRNEFFSEDGQSWAHDYCLISTPVSRPLHQRIWEMGRGETPETCEWNVKNGELAALEDLIRRMLSYEPSQRITAAEAMESEYMVKWAIPAWRRQLSQES